MSRRKTPWLGNGDGHVYEFVMTPPEPRTWGPLDCPSFVRVCHPENWPNDRYVPRALRRDRPKGTRKSRAKRQEFDAPRAEAGVASVVAKAGLLQLALLVHQDRGE